MTEKVLIIGADGFIGKYVTKLLEKDFVIEKFQEELASIILYLYSG